MKSFVYKSLFIFFCIFVLFHITIGYKIRSIEKQLSNLTSKENLMLIKSKIREEMKNAVKKERYLDPIDAKLIADFVNKIQEEINLQK